MLIITISALAQHLLAKCLAYTVYLCSAAHFRYLTSTEWSTLYGGHKATSEVSKRAQFKRLPFNCCSLSMQPFEHPYCTEEGVIFDLV